MNKMKELENIKKSFDDFCKKADKFVEKRTEQEKVIQEIPTKTLEWGETSEKEMTWQEAKDWCEDQHNASDITRIPNNYYEQIKTLLATLIQQAITEERERVKGIIEGVGTVYYRSRFSQDCSRNETEEEKNTEMVELAEIKRDLLSSLDKEINPK